VFILDLGLKLFQWNGKEANKYEKVKGLDMINQIKDQERGGKPQVFFLDSGKDEPESAEFWKVLGDKGAVKSAAEGGADEDVFKGQQIGLFRVSDASGQLEIKEVAKGQLKQEMLDPNDVFVLDAGTSLFVWIGKGATAQEKKKGMEFGVKFLKEQNRPDWTPISRVVQGSETPLFKCNFFIWNEPKPVAKAAVEEKKRGPDVSALYQKQAAAAQKMIQNIKGDISVWRMENFNKVAVDAALHGQFFAGDSYIVLFKYMDGQVEKAIIYFWQGRDSSVDEKGASAIFTKQLDDELGIEATQVRVVQNKEPDHFLALFKGKMIVHAGGIASGFKNVNDKDSYDTDGVSLYHIRGTNEINTRAVQVEEKAASLNSSDCFVLLTPPTMFVWLGKGANAEEAKVAKNIANVLKGKRAVQEVKEGAEPAPFWEALHGKGEYPSDKELQANPKDPRLFNCSNRHGWFKIEEIMDYSQDDLLDDDVMILDTCTEVYVWVGSQARPEEKDAAFTAALDFIEKSPDGRPKETPVFKIDAGKEPPFFTCHFLGWNAQKALQPPKDVYGDKLKAMKGAAKGAAPRAASPQKGAPAAAEKKEAPAPTSKADFAKVTRSDAGRLDPTKHKFPMKDLIANKVANIDVQKKEQYLSEAEFKAAFNMTLDEFNKLPAWKQSQLKKKVGLF
jgi:villin 1/advillin